MAIGIELYKHKKYDGFEDSEETVKFTTTINNIFDALNRRHTFEGIKKNSHDFEVFYVLPVCMLHVRVKYLLYVMV